MNDWIAYGVVGIFLAIMLGVGIVAKTFVKDADDFHRGGRQVPWWAAGLSIYMGAFSAFAFVSFGSVVFTDGGVGLLLGYGLVFSYVLTGLFLARRWHRAALTTPAEYLEQRFGPAARQFVAFLTLVTNAMASALRLFAFALMMNGLLGLPVLPTIVIAGAMMAAVAISGGLWGIVLADAVQFVILLAGLIPLVIMSVLQLGGWAEFSILATTDLFAVGRGDKGWNWLLTWWLLQIITGMFSFPMIQRLSSVPTERDARKAVFLAAALLVPTPLLAMVPVAICFVLLPGTPPELAFATIAKTVLPVGLLGLMAGSMIAATVSELETAFNIDSGIVTRDVYQRHIHPEASPRRLLALSRLATLASATIAITLATVLAATGTGIFDFSEAFSSRVVMALCIPFVLGILVRRISERGFFLTVACSLVASFVLWWIGLSSGDVRLPLAAVGFGSVALGALLFPPRGQSKVRIGAFFDRLAQPCPSPENGRLAIDLQTIRLVGVTILLVGIVPALLPLVAATTGPARLIEYGAGGVLFAIGAALIFFGRAPPHAKRETSS